MSDKFKTNADMLQESYCYGSILEGDLNKIVTKISENLQGDPVPYNLFFREHTLWRKWVHLTVGLEREIIEGTIGPVLAQSLRIQLIESRIDFLKERLAKIESQRAIGRE
jgi:hypothetical protein